MPTHTLKSETRVHDLAMDELSCQDGADLMGGNADDRANSLSYPECVFNRLQSS